MDKISAFFRVFDLAFFAPGALLLLTLWYVSDGGRFDLSIDLFTAAGIIAVIVVFTLTYILGLLCHSLQRVMYGIVGRRIVNWLSRSKVSASWYQNLEAESRDDLAQYFWYMRSTCWNLATAIAISSAYAQVQSKLSIPGGWFVVIAAILLLLFAGFEFHCAMKRASKT